MGTPFQHGEAIQAACLFVCLKYKEMYNIILKSLNIVDLYRVMSLLKLKINLNLAELLCIVISAALNGQLI